MMSDSAGDGTLAWYTEMSEALRYGEVPMLVTSGRVTTMALDQKITAYDALSGSQVWNLEQAVYDTMLRLSGDSLMVLDYLPYLQHELLRFRDEFRHRHRPGRAWKFPLLRLFRGVCVAF